MFAREENLNGDISSPNADISSWDVSSVTDMSFIFFYAAKFNVDISAWDVSSVTNMSHMFFNAETFQQKKLCWDLRGKNRQNMFAGSLCSVNQCILGECPVPVAKYSYSNGCKVCL